MHLQVRLEGTVWERRFHTSTPLTVLLYKFNVIVAAAQVFNSLIPAPSVPLLISTEPVELLCRAGNISTTDPFCFLKQKQ